MSARGFLFDVNIWLALAFQKHADHERARSVFREAGADRPALMCRATELGFLRIATTGAFSRSVGAESFSNRAALAVLRGFLSSASVRWTPEPEGLATLWHELADRATASPKVWMDAYLAAFAIKGRWRLVTADHDMDAFVAAGLEVQMLTR